MASQSTDLSVPFRALSFASLAEGEPQKSETLTEALKELLVPVVFDQFLQTAQDTIERLRTKVYKKIGHESTIGSFQKDFELVGRLQRELMLLSRFEMESDQVDAGWGFSFKSSRYLKKFVPIRSDGSEKKSLSDLLALYYKRRADMIKQHLVLASNLFSNHLETRNLDANYRLQRRIEFWTVLVSFATIYGLIQPHWEAFERIVKLIWSKLH